MKILFFMRTGERTGSEVALHNIICNADRRRFQLAVASNGSGPLLRRMPPDVPVFLYGQPAPVPRFHRRVIRRIRRVFVTPPAPPDPVLSVIREYRPDVCYVNTIVQSSVLRSVGQSDVPCVLHSHELEQALESLHEQDVRNLLEVPQLIIAASQAVANVFHVLGRKENVEICPESIVCQNVSAKAGSAAALRKKLGIRDGAFVWAMSGTIDWNKNPGLFVDIAAEMIRQDLNVHFLWLGSPRNGYSYYAKRKSETLGLAGSVTWAGALADEYCDYLNVADAFVLTSTRDSFPLVMLEAAALGKPIVSFNSGGVKDFVRPGMGVVIDSWNAADLVAAMRKMMSGEIVIRKRALQERAKEFDAAHVVRRWEALIIKHFAHAQAAAARPNRADGSVNV